MKNLVQNQAGLSLRVQGWLALAIGVGLWYWFCWPMMSGQTVVGFRDSAYLYYPLFEWIDEQWAAGEFPLWNPYCNFGMPIVGDGTPSLLYPGKLIFCCRFLSFPARYGIYLALHLFLAGVGTFWLARMLKANRAGATMAAISYASGGCVLFQVTNVIYLVSAAWLPIALACVWQMTRTGQLKWAIAAGAVCALMILGGDPQMVYHIGLIAAATGGSRFVQRFKRARQAKRNSRLHGRSDNESVAANPFHAAIRHYGLLVAMVIATVLFSLVQLWPTYDWSKLSERTRNKQPTNLYQVIGQADFSVAGLQSARQTLLGPPTQGTIADHAYQFSLPPWSLAELFWPNSSGKIFPTHQRWADVLPGAERIWFPSLYLGLLTIWLALGGFRLRGRGRCTWLTRIGLFFGLASFGWYGAVWLINEILPVNLRLTELGPQVGGVYWLMMVGLPKYFSFRYPAKLFLIASLCLCLLAGIRLRDWRLKFSGTWVMFFGGLTAVGFVILATGMHDKFFNRVPADGLFGPFDAGGATRELMFCFGQVGLVLIAMKLIEFKRLPFKIWVIVLLTSIDLAIANRWLLAEVPSSVMISNGSDWRDEAPEGVGTIAPPTIYRPRGAAFLPSEFGRAGSLNRLDEIIKWQWATLYPKQHLGRDVRLVGSFTSIWPEQYENLLRAIELRESQAGDLTDAAHRAALTAFKSRWCDGEVIASRSEGDSKTEIAWFAARPRLVFLTSAPFQPTHLTASSMDSLNGDSVGAIQPDMSSKLTCDLVLFSSNSLAVRVSTEQSRWLVYNTIFDGNWRAEIKAVGSEEVENTSLVELAEGYQGIPIKAGDFEIRLSYQPNNFWLAAWISGFCWGMASFGMLISRIIARRS